MENYLDKFSPLALINRINDQDDLDLADIVVTKRSLQRLGYYKLPRWGLTDVTDDQMFKGIRSFQYGHGLKQDGVLEPDGETATEIGRALSNRTPFAALAQNDGSPDDKPTAEQCDHLYWNIDIPTCRGVLLKRGKRGAARCFHTATWRYALCLKGRPINELPPLDTWVP